MLMQMVQLLSLKVMLDSTKIFILRPMAGQYQDLMQTRLLSLICLLNKQISLLACLLFRVVL